MSTVKTAKFMDAKYKGTCTETEQKFNKGASIYYDGKNAYCEDSNRYREEKELKEATKEATDTANLIQAQEDAFYDNFSEQDSQHDIFW